MTTHFKLRAYGKINLGLDVLRRREDGYHEVRMIMQTVGLYDQIDLFFRKEPGIEIETNLSYLPVNENNLVYKAANLLMEEFQVKNGVFIRLRKLIPVALPKQRCRCCFSGNQQDVPSGPFYGGTDGAGSKDRG